MRYPVVASVVLLMACGPASPGRTVQRLLDVYAPDLPLGGRVTADAHKRYRLHVAPYDGYIDDAYTGADGVRHLTITVYPAPDDSANARVRFWATISNVELDVPSSEVTARVDARIRAVLGLPSVGCYKGFRDGVSRWIETRYWAGEHGRGVLMLVFRNPVSEPPSVVGPVGLAQPVFTGPDIFPPEEFAARRGSVVQGQGTVTFGAEPVTIVRLELCDTAAILRR
jgi:hypothetical protein